ncbi:hypothetical protein NQ317_001995 [Molorchus minor]|uniref:Ribosomal protein S14 n=1 Tax=Molorchus minor TaxID=1323400 RepID=A0ABQ9IR99_9CUCU|nr:hypothetical protein NQ317_001995 [Molorchus minor]
MGIIFGKKKPPSRVTEQDKAVLQLKQQRDKLKLYQKKIELALNKDREVAKQLINKGQKKPNRVNCGKRICNSAASVRGMQLTQQIVKDKNPVTGSFNPYS